MQAMNTMGSNSKRSPTLARGPIAQITTLKRISGPQN